MCQKTATTTIGVPPTVVTLLRDALILPIPTIPRAAVSMVAMTITPVRQTVVKTMPAGIFPWVATPAVRIAMCVTEKRYAGLAFVLQRTIPWTAMTTIPALLIVAVLKQEGAEMC